MNSVDIGKFIAQLRKERNLTQNDLADLLQVTNKAISRWETGEGFPDIMILPKLGEVLGVSIDELLNGVKKIESGIQKGKPQLRFSNTYLINHMVLATAFIVFLALTYITFKVWIGIIGYVIPTSFSIVWFFMEKNRFVFDSEYTNEDRMLIRKYIRRLIITFNVLTSLVLVQFIMIAIEGQFVNSVVKFDTYLLYGSIVSIIVFLVSIFVIYIIDKGLKNIFPRNIQIGTYAFLLNLLLILTIDIFSITLIVLLICCTYVLINMFLLIKEKKPYYYVLIVLLPFIILPVFWIPGASEFVLFFIFVLLWEFVCLAGSIHLWIKRYKSMQFDFFYWVSYQNLTLAISFILVIIYSQFQGIDTPIYFNLLISVGVLIIVTVLHMITNMSVFYKKTSLTS